MPEETESLDNRGKERKPKLCVLDSQATPVICPLQRVHEANAGLTGIVLEGREEVQGEARLGNVPHPR